MPMAKSEKELLSKKELLAHVWQYADAGIETRTVDIHIQKLRKKIISLIGDVSFLETIRGEGYRLETGGETPGSGPGTAGHNGP